MSLTDATTLKRTPLHAMHASLGAKFVPFGGYEMPVSYPAGIAAEHRAVRTGVGVFDVSHMGEFEVTGPDRNAFVQRVTCNDVGALKPGQAQYSAILTDQGTFVDDCLVYRFADRLMLVVNAANIAADWAHVVAQKRGRAVRARGARHTAARGGLPPVRERHRCRGDAVRGGTGLDRKAREGRRLHGTRRVEAAEARGRETPARGLQGDRAEGRRPARLRRVPGRPAGGRGAQRYGDADRELRDRDDLPPGGRGQAGDPVHDRRARQAGAGGSGPDAVCGAKDQRAVMGGNWRYRAVCVSAS